MVHAVHPTVVLIVDDEPYSRAFAAKTLRAAGHRTIAAATHEEALAHLAIRRPDLVLADGDRLAPERLLAASWSTPIVATTAREAAFGDWAARGFAGLVPKPFDVGELLAAVAALARRVHCDPA